jgi:hypothetical protein
MAQLKELGSNDKASVKIIKSLTINKPLYKVVDLNLFTELMSKVELRQ